MTEMQLVKTLESQITEAEASAYEVGEQRERNHRYYALQPLGNEINGRSQYISPDVLQSVEDKKALFAETFFSGRRVVWFTGEDKDEADARTAYVEMQLKKNNVYELFRDAWHDSFVAKRLTILAEWKEDEEEIILELKGANQGQLEMIIQQQSKQSGEIININREGLVQDQPAQANDLTFSGQLILQVDRSSVDLTLLQPERCYRDPNATYLRDSLYFTMEDDVSRGELVQDGFDVEQVEALTMDHRYRGEEEDNNRKSHDSSWTRRQQHKRTTEQELVTKYTTWTWIDLSDYDLEDELDPKNRAADSVEEDQDERFGSGRIDADELVLAKIHWSQGEILRWADGTLAIEEATEIPAFEWTEFKISHAEHGLADADLVMHTQKTQSVLKRLVIDNQQMKNTSRLIATVGAIKNPRELLDNSIGGTIWARSTGDVKALEVPEVSQASMAVISMLDNDRQSRSGMSSLSTGMNTDAIRYQNSKDMVDRLTTAGTRRPMKAARDFANTCMIPLCQYIYKLGVRNDTQTHSEEVKGTYHTLKPSSWPDTEVGMKVAVALTPDECDAHSSTLVGMYQLQATDPDLKIGFGYQQKHAMLEDIYDCMGVTDSSTYLLRPDSDEYIKKQKFVAEQQRKAQQQQEAASQLQQKMQDQQISLDMSRQEFDQWLKKDENGRAWLTYEIAEASAHMEADDMIADNIRKDEELVHKISKDNQEIELEKRQRRPVSIS